MTHSNKCTLIVNVYNQAKQLDLLLESALKQTEQNFEIIVADCQFAGKVYHQFAD